MTKFRTRIGRFEAPVDYQDIRVSLQHVRVGAASIIFTASAISVYFDVPGASVSAALALAVMIHAFVRSRMPHSPTEVLVVDAIAISMGLGAGDHASAPLIAGVAYLIAASLTFGGLKSLLWTLSSISPSIMIRTLLRVPDPATLPTAGEVIGFVTIAVFLTAIALSLMAAATEVFKARGLQTKALETERRASEIKSEFVSMVTHELRTPLTNISGFTDTLQETWQTLSPVDVDEFLQIIVSESEHLKNLVEDVLVIPRLEAGRLLLDSTDFPLRPAVFKVIDLLFSERESRSASVSIGSNVMIHADPNRVEQILRNLIENANKYGGDLVSVEAIPLGDEWQIVVSDNGAGLSSADRERVFEAFEQVTSGDARTHTGVGLGLAIARHLIAAMGGRIWYEPGFPVGARFCFTLPIARSTPGVGTVAEVA